MPILSSGTQSDSLYAQLKVLPSPLFVLVAGQFAMRVEVHGTNWMLNLREKYVLLQDCN